MNKYNLSDTDKICGNCGVVLPDGFKLDCEYCPHCDYAEFDKSQPRVLCHFSCGAASAVATKMAIEQYGKKRVHIMHIEIAEEHSDNKRFLEDCENWFGVPIHTVKNEKFKGSIFAVFEQSGFIKNQFGAKCTTELKRKVRAEHQLPNDIHIFGFTAEEEQRAIDFEQRNAELNCDWLLINNNVSKQDCLGIIASEGIEIPTMYKLGYINNNCIGCVKGGMGYWNKIRKDFPEAFDRMAKKERAIGYALLKDKNGMVFLDELDPNRGRYEHEPDIECSFICRDILGVRDD